LHGFGFKLGGKPGNYFVTFLHIRSQIAQVDKHMSAPQQVEATQTSARTQDEFFGSHSEPGIEPVERTHASAVLRWPEYVMEGAMLGLFMISACVFTTILQLPHSPIRQAISSAILRRVLTGIAMGLTAIALIYSPWGQRHKSSCRGRASRQ
jgi:hypothetical protein